jgi:hypothetical protein
METPIRDDAVKMGMKKESVFPFDPFEKADIFLRPEMRSTGDRRR